MGSEGREGIRNETTGMIAYIRYIRVFNFIIFSLTSKQAEASLFRKAWCKRAKITCIYIYIILFTRCGTSLEFTYHQISIIKLRRHVSLNSIHSNSITFVRQFQRNDGDERRIKILLEPSVGIFVRGDTSDRSSPTTCHC